LAIARDIDSPCLKGNKRRWGSETGDKY